MLSRFLVLCLVALSTTSAEYTLKLLDTETPILTEKACPNGCGRLMNIGILGIHAAFATVLREISFETHFGSCKYNVGDFDHTHDCTTNSAEDTFDHVMNFTFKEPVLTCSCDLPNNPSAAAEKINSGEVPTGSCGKDSLSNKIPYQKIVCDNDASQAETGKPVQLKETLTGLKLIIAFRAESSPGEETVSPLRITMILEDKNPFTLVDSPEFEKALACISNDKNLPSFSQQLYTNGFTKIFSCLANKKGEKTFSLIDRLFYIGGNCKSFFGLGR